MVRVGSARIDENGKVSGGVAGDQTGLEVAVEPWYLHSKGWVIIRAKDDAVRERIAQCMERACANDNIGYNQDRSWEVYDLSKPYGWDCSKISKPCSSDCSNLVRTCVAYAVQRPVTWFSTLNEVSVLSSTGIFDVIEDTKYTTADTYLKRGDILNTCTQGHTVVVLDNGSGIASRAEPESKIIGIATAKTAMYVRDGADKTAKALGTVAKGETVKVLELTPSGWYRIVWEKSESGYSFTKAGESYYSFAQAVPEPIEVGDKVYYNGSAQYISAWSLAPVPSKAGYAKVTQICANGKHKYHIIGDNVYGWVDEDTLVKE